MIDKETIVNGIQVRECGHYWNGTCHAYTDNTGKFLLCINSPNCYYKQLKRAENQIVDLNKMVEAKEQECEIWKNQVLAIDNEAITIQITQQQFEEYNQFKQTLDEIKEIANYSFNRSTSEYMAKLELILEKINEVKNDKR